MLKRLIDFYRHNPQPSKSKSGSIWQGVSQRFHAKLISALESGDESAVEAQLATMNLNLFGIENAHVLKWDGEECRASIERLAQSVGLLPMPHSEQPSPNSNGRLKDVAEMKQKLEAYFGFSFDVPSHLGFSLGGNGVLWRFLLYCAAWASVKPNIEPQQSRILEIGAGLGNLGYIAFKSGVKSYDVIDLPQVAVLSAYALSKVVPEDRIWMDGEPMKDDTFASFYACTNYNNCYTNRYDLIFNSDSLPEMTHQFRSEYRALILETLTPTGIFASVNHESNAAGQSSVRSLMHGFRTLARHPFYFRPGYVEEMYVV